MRLRKKGESKEKAARIANAVAGSSKSAVGHKGGKSHSYDEWKKEDLVKRAKEVGIKGRSTMKKAELVKALRCRSDPAPRHTGIELLGFQSVGETVFRCDVTVGAGPLA